MTEFSGKSDGFTLVELVVVVLTVGFILPTFVLAFSQATKHLSDIAAETKTTAIAGFLLQQKMEELIKYSYDDPDLSIVQQQSFPTGYSGYSGTYSIAYIDEDLAGSPTDEGYKKISVYITDPNGADYEVHTIVSQWTF